MAAPARLQIDRRRGEPALRCRGPSANSAHDRGRGRLDRLRGASVCLAPRHDLLARVQRCVQRQPGAARSCGTLAAAARLSGRGPVVEIGGLRRLVHEHDRSRDVRSNTTLSSTSIKSTSASPGCCRWQRLRALPCCRIPPATRGTESPSATGEPRRSVAVPVDQGWRQPDRAAGRNAPRGVCTRGVCRWAQRQAAAQPSESSAPVHGRLPRTGRCHISVRAKRLTARACARRARRPAGTSAG